MIRQVYGLGGANIDPGSFGLRIERVDPSTDMPQYDENGVAYLQIFGLDAGDDYGMGARDEEPDLMRGTLFDLYRGLLKFPEDFAKPFAAEQAQYEANTVGTNFAWRVTTFLTDNLVPTLYEIDTSPAEIAQLGKFRFVMEHYDLYDEP